MFKTITHLSYRVFDFVKGVPQSTLSFVTDRLAPVSNRFIIINDPESLRFCYAEKSDDGDSITP